MRSRPRTRTTYGTPSESSIRWSSSRTNTGGLTGWTARRAGRDNQPRVPTLKLSRHPVERHPSDRPIEAGAERTIEVLVREERVDVEKQAVVYEEVGVGKRQVTETEQVSGTARREEARVEREGDVDVRGWNEAMPRYRQRWESRYGSTGGRWEDDEPSYRFGYAMRSRPEYRGRTWSEMEPQLRSGWERLARSRGQPRGRGPLPCSGSAQRRPIRISSRPGRPTRTIRPAAEQHPILPILD